MAQWQGPYPVLRQVGPVSFQIDEQEKEEAGTPREHASQVVCTSWRCLLGEEVADGVGDEIRTWDKGSVPKEEPVLGD